MTTNTAIVIVTVGAVAGLVSGLVSKSKGKGFNLPVHLVIGIIGGFHGRLLLNLVDISASGVIGHIIFAGVGAALFLFALRFIKPA